MFLALLMAVFGFLSAVLIGGSQVLKVIGPLRDVRDDLALLPPREAMQVYIAEVQQLPVPEMMAAISNLVQDPWSLMFFENSGASDTALEVQFFAILITGTVLGLVLTMSFVRWITRRLRDHKASERMLGVDILMIVFALPLFLLGILPLTSPLFIVGIVLGLLAYKLMLRWLLKDRRHLVSPAQSRSLLMLRVFGHSRRSQ